MGARQCHRRPRQPDRDRALQRLADAQRDRRAQRAVAISFWLLAPYIAVESIRNLISDHHPEASLLGILLTASSLIVMPWLGRAKPRLGSQLESRATAGEDIQNYMCAAQAAAVLVSLVALAIWSATGWLDAVIGLGTAAWSLWEGREAWNGEECC